MVTEKEADRRMGTEPVGKLMMRRKRETYLA